MAHSTHSKPDETLAELLPISGSREYFNESVVNRDGRPKEWWYVFALQFLLWWSLWSAYDSVMDLMGSSGWNALTRLQLYLVEVLIGTGVYFMPFPSSLASAYLKLKCFCGMVLICCGLWNLLEALASTISTSSGIPILILYLTVLSLTATLGGIHHYAYRENYLIDMLI